MNNLPDSREAAAALLVHAGIHATRQRVEIAWAIFARGGHLSAEQVLAAVNEHHATSSKATVYNTLKLFVEKGLLREVIAHPNRVFYDANIAPHHHFYDVSTGRLSDIDADGVEVRGLPPPPDGVVTEGVDIVVRVRSRPPA